MLRIGILTSGGDCQTVNAAMRGVIKGLGSGDGEITIYGFRDGYRGLMYEDYEVLSEEDFSDIFSCGGTILGTSRQPFRKMRVPDENGCDKVELMKATYHRLELDCLVILGGCGTQKSANLLRQEGLNVITLPQTIDNDIWGTEESFGYQSAVEVATEYIDRVRTTAESHGRVFLVEIMGHNAGWITLNAGIAGGADVILIPEIPYHIKKLAELINTRREQGRRSTIFAVAEGAVPFFSSPKGKEEVCRPMSYRLAEELRQITGQEIRVSVPGYIQRGGGPCACDRVLASRMGAVAAGLILNKEYGYMVSTRFGMIDKVPLEAVAGKSKRVNPQADIIKQAKMLGIHFGDE